MKPTLAINGGPAAVTSATPARVRWGAAERAQLEEMLEQPSLFYWRGPQTQLLVQRFQEYYPLEHVMPCSSGTAAVHIAVAVAGIGPGDEVIVPPITDMGTVIGVPFQGGVPVFADLDPRTYNLDPRDVEMKITARTKAVIAVHLTGNPCAMMELKALCEAHGLVLIEDCAQAWGSLYRSTPVGTLGHIGCWSLNDFKHIGCGDGGLVASNDEHFGPLLQKFGDKAYDRSGGGRMPDVLAANYRISEPQSAVAAAQMTRMWDMTEARAQAGRGLNALLDGVAGILPHGTDPRDRWTCWFYMLRLDTRLLTCDNATFAAALAAEGVPCKAGYIGTPLYRYPVFQNHNFLGGRWPTQELGLTSMDYREVCCPQAENILRDCIQIVVNEATTASWIEEAAAAVRKVAAYYV